jgi:PAS domain S-box-containing protein
MTDGEASASADPVFLGDSGMARRLRRFAWETSPLGPAAAWPTELQSACRICLTSRFPMIVWWGPQFNFVYNDAYEPLLGAKHPAVGKTGREVWPEIWHIVGPMLESVLASGRATWSEDLLLPMERHGYWEETYWTYSYSPLHDDEGVVRGVFTAVSDTTERVIGARRLAALQDLSSESGTARSVAEACRLVADALGRAQSDVAFSVLYLRGPDGEPILSASSPGAETLRPEILDPAAWPLREVLATGMPVSVTGLGARFEGLPRGGWRTPPAEALVLPLPGDAGSGVVGAMVLAARAGRALDEGYRAFLGLVARQTSAMVNGAVAYQAQRRRAEELAELDRAKTAFFSNISHEFRTPLTLITGPVQDLRDRLAGGDERDRRDLEVIHRNGLRLGKLVNTLLDFSRIEAGRMRAEFRPADLALLTADLAGVFRAAIEAAGLDFEVDCLALPEPVYADAEMWEKIVLNLLSNALKFCFEGSVRVRLAAEDGAAVLRVADTGIGIAAKDMPRLFERFHRIPNARARSGEGSGIGLALVRELVDLHAGTIAVESEEGAGTTFTVRLPFGHGHLPAAQVASGPSDRAAPSADPPRPTQVAEPFVHEALRWLPSAATEAAAGAEDDRPGARPRVLVADDNSDMREYLVRLLRPDYRVDAVADGRAALHTLRADPPDLVVSDVMMPQLDGIGLVTAIRADPGTAGVPVLLLSARAGQEAAIEGIAAGADEYLFKPFSAAELLARVRGAIGVARLRRSESAWRTTLIESLQEGFFVCEADGTVVETNTAFTQLLGFGGDGHRYALPHPWWPEENSDPEAHRMVAEAFESTIASHGGSFVVPLQHRDGRRLWAAVTVNEVRDERERRMIVGTVRDVTEERYAVRRESAMAAMSLRLSRTDGGAEALAAALDELRGLWHVRRALAVAWDAAGLLDVVAAAPEGKWGDLAPAARVAIGGLREELPLHPVVLATPTANGAGVRLDAPEGPLAVWLDLPETGPRLGVRDQTLLALLCGYLGQILHRAHRFEQQRYVALTLQRAMLAPSQMPDGFAVRYEPAGRPLEVGGDWYDAFELPGGRVGIVLGDCVGRGLSAATVMGQLRSAARALLLRADGPADVLEALDEFAAGRPGAACATVFCGILETDTGRLTYASAGHPPPILVPPGAEAELLDRAGSAALAVGAPVPRPTATCRIPDGSLLLIYTDGLVERRREPLEAGIARAARLLAGMAREPVERIADRIMTLMRPDGAYEDDVAVLLYRHTARITIAFPPDAGELAGVRGRLRDWLAGQGLDALVIQDLLIAAGEACANGVEHGNRHGTGRDMRLTAACGGGELHMTVWDGGTWKPPDAEPNPYRGHGLAMIRAMMDDVGIETGPGGTTVSMRKRVAS